MIKKRTKPSLEFRNALTTFKTMHAKCHSLSFSTSFSDFVSVWLRFPTMLIWVTFHFVFRLRKASVFKFLITAHVRQTWRCVSIRKWKSTTSSMPLLSFDTTLAISHELILWRITSFVSWFKRKQVVISFNFALIYTRHTQRWGFLCLNKKADIKLPVIIKISPVGSS